MTTLLNFTYFKNTSAFFTCNNKRYEYKNSALAESKETGNKFISYIFNCEVGKEIETLNNYIKCFGEICNLLTYDANYLNYSVQNLTKFIGYNCFEKLYKSAELDDFEQDYCIKNLGAINYVNTDIETNENTTTYDMNSAYGYSISQSTLCWVFNQGEKCKIDTIGNKYKNAYYFIEVDIKTLPFYYKLKTNILWVTNYDLLTFDLYETKYKLIDDCVYNAYTYEDQKRITAIETIIKKLYAIKQTNYLVRQVLQLLHGVLFRKEAAIKTVTKADMDSMDYFIDCDAEGNDLLKVINKKAGKIVYNFTRNNAFFMSYSRYTMSRFLSHLIKNNVTI
jgi:hypothetical protein